MIFSTPRGQRSQCWIYSCSEFYNINPSCQDRSLYNNGWRLFVCSYPNFVASLCSLLFRNYHSKHLYNDSLHPSIHWLLQISLFKWAKQSNLIAVEDTVYGNFVISATISWHVSWQCDVTRDSVTIVTSCHASVTCVPSLRWYLHCYSCMKLYNWVSCILIDCARPSEVLLFILINRKSGPEIHLEMPLKVVLHH